MIYVGAYYAIGLLMALAIDKTEISWASFVVAAIWPLPLFLAIFHSIRWNRSCK